MKQLNRKWLVGITAGTGLAALLARTALYRVGLDDRGLLIRFHPLGILFWVLTAAALLTAVLGSGKLSKTERQSSLGILPGMGSFAMGMGLALLQLFGGTWGLDRILCLAAAGCLMADGILRMADKKPGFLLNLTACVYFAFRLIASYRGWRGSTQLLEYVPSMGAQILLMLYAYQQAAGDLGKTTARAHTLWGLAAGFFCIAALLEPVGFPMYLGGCLWCMTGVLAEKTERMG